MKCLLYKSMCFLIFKLKYLIIVNIRPSTAHIKYSSVMLALYIYIYCFGEEHKTKFDFFFVLDYQIIPYGLMTLALPCAELA